MAMLRDLVAVMYRRVPAVRGYQRPLKPLNKWLLKLGGDQAPIVTVPMKLHYTMKVDLRSRTEYRAFYTGRYDTERIAALSELIVPGSAVLDIGANIGFYTIPFAKAVGPNGVVHAFEPVESNVAALRENIAINTVHSIVHVHPVGLSDHEGTASITLREDFQDGSKTGNAAILIEDGTDDRFVHQSIILAPLDSIEMNLNGCPVTLIKIDVEGHEDYVFAGATNFLSLHRPVIVAELNEDYFVRRDVDLDTRLKDVLLEPLDYAVLSLNQDGVWVPTDTLSQRTATDDVVLVPREKMEEILQLLKTKN